MGTEEWAPFSGRPAGPPACPFARPDCKTSGRGAPDGLIRDVHAQSEILPTLVQAVCAPEEIIIIIKKPQEVFVVRVKRD